MSAAAVSVPELAARLFVGARDNAYSLGYADGSDGAYRRDEVFGGDDALGARYDSGFAAAEWEAAREFDENSDGFTTARFAGAFVRCATHDGTPEGIQAAHAFVRGGAA